MGLRVLCSRDEESGVITECLVDTTVRVAFGPLVTRADEDEEGLWDWLQDRGSRGEVDLRTLTESEVLQAWGDWQSAAPARAAAKVIRAKFVRDLEEAADSITEMGVVMPAGYTSADAIEILEDVPGFCAGDLRSSDAGDGNIRLAYWVSGGVPDWSVILIPSRIPATTA